MDEHIEELFNTIFQFKTVVANLYSEAEDGRATMLQFSALNHIQENPNLSVAEVGRLLHLSKSSSTQLIERLEKAGFTKRVQDKKDRRITHLSISGTGKKELKESKKKMLAKMGIIFSHLPEKDILDLVRIHKTLLNKLMEGNKQ